MFTSHHKKNLELFNFDLGTVDRSNSKQRKIFGNMTGRMNDSESLDSDSDLLLDGDLTDDDDLEIDNHPVRNFSDDDF